jgi:hypothetical protein
MSIGKEDTLPLPVGFSVVAKACPDLPHMQKQWGGVLVVIQDNVPYSIIESVSCPDLLVLDLDTCFLMGVYLPPVSAFWQDWSDIEPERKVAKAMAFCTASYGKPLLVVVRATSQNGCTNKLSWTMLSRGNPKLLLIV